MEVQIRNFQAIRQAKLLIDGITCVVGDTNSGKTSIVRAMTMAIFNYQTPGFVNAGAKKAQVLIKFDASNFLAWEKKAKGSAFYVVNGKKFTRTGRSQLPEVAAMGLQEIEVARAKWHLQFWRQLEEPFLVFQSPATIFEFVSKVQEDRRVLPVLKEMDVDARVFRDDAIRLEGAIQALGDKIKVDKEKFKINKEALTSLAPLVAELETNKAQLEQIKDMARSVVVIDRQILELSSKETQMKALHDVLASLDTEGSHLESLLTLRNQINTIDSTIGAVDQELSKLSAVPGLLSDLQDVQLDGEFFSVVSRLTTIDKQLEDADVLTGEIVLEKQDLDLEYQDLRASLEECPACGAEMVNEHVHATDQS